MSAASPVAAKQSTPLRPAASSPFIALEGRTRSDPTSTHTGLAVARAHGRFGRGLTVVTDPKAAAAGKQLDDDKQIAIATICASRGTSPSTLDRALNDDVVARTRQRACLVASVDVVEPDADRHPDHPVEFPPALRANLRRRGIVFPDDPDAWPAPTDGAPRSRRKAIRKQAQPNPRALLHLSPRHPPRTNHCASRSLVAGFGAVPPNAISARA